MKSIVPLALLLSLLDLHAQPRDKELPKFMGRQVTILEPGHDPDGYFPLGPASICVEGPPQRQCYTAPETFGNNPTVELVQLDKNTPVLLFSVETGGISGWGIHFALLRFGMGKDLEDMFPDITVSNQSQHAFWADAPIYDAQIFVTAEYAQGPDDGHYGEHRYIISVYVRRASTMMPNDIRYFLEDQYMTTRKYDLEAKADVLTSERQEILSRLRRLSAERKIRPQRQR